MSAKRAIFLRSLKGVLFLMISVSGFSQFNLFRNFSVKDGLPSSEVYEMLEDSKGYFWFATDMGVSKFNGYGFKNFSSENGLPDNTIYGIYEDARQNIWFRSLSGKLSYYANNEIRTLPCNNELIYILKNLTVTSLFVDSRDTIWMGVTNNFLLKIAPGRHRQDIIKVPIPNDGLYVYEVEDGFVYGGFPPNKNLVTLYKNGKVIKTEINTGPVIKEARYFVNRLKDKSYLVALNTTVLNFSRKGIIYRYENDRFNICTLEDVNGNNFVGTYNGLKSIDKNGFQYDRSYKMLDQKIVTALKIDKEKELWICTKGHGVFYIPYRNFKYYTPADGLPESSISCISEIGDKVLSGHLNGRLSVFSEAGLKVITLENKDSIVGIANEVTSLLKYNDQKTFISSINSIYEFDNISGAAKLIKNTGSKKLIRQKGTTLMVSLGFRILRTYDESFNVLDERTLPNYSDNLFESNQKILICSSNGLWLFDKEAALNYAGEKDTLLASRIVDVAESKNGVLWYATRGEGVIIHSKGKLLQIQQKDGLSSNMCRTLLLDSANVVWVATNNGLNKIVIENYSPLKYHIENYSSKNGLLTNEINYMVRVKNNLWLAHNNGISVFDPNDLQGNKTPPPVYITAILVNDINLGTDKPVTLPYDKNYITINYNGLSFKDPGHINYKYRLEGLDTNWRYTQYTSVNFQSIEPGMYKFIIYAQNNNGYWSASPATYEFVIDVPWWRTWWFISLVILAIIALSALPFIYWLKYADKRARLRSIRSARLYPGKNALTKNSGMVF